MFALFIHPTALSQYRHIVQALVARGSRVAFICQTVAERLAGVDYLPYSTPGFAASAADDTLSMDFMAAARRGAAVAAVCETLAAAGRVPDVIFGHGGWGETMYVKDVFPDTPLINYLEFYYYADGLDLGFDAEFDPLFLDKKRLQARNAPIAISSIRADLSTVPTRWQQSVLPVELRRRSSVLHEGVDTAEVCPQPGATFTLPDNAGVVGADDQVITYVSRSLEPYRGFHSFMRALPAVLARHPKARVVIAGAEGTSYGAALPTGSSYKQLMLRELGTGLPLERIHFCGTLPRKDYLQLLRVSSAHVYLTYPLFLSWSCLEAMSSQCLLIGSRTGPVTDVIEHDRNGWLVDFFDTAALAEALGEALSRPKALLPLRKRARDTIKQQFDLRTQCLPQWLELADRNLRFIPEHAA